MLGFCRMGDEWTGREGQRGDLGSGMLEVRGVCEFVTIMFLGNSRSLLLVGVPKLV